MDLDHRKSGFLIRMPKKQQEEGLCDCLTSGQFWGEVVFPRMHCKVVRSQTLSLPGCVSWILRQTSLIRQNKEGGHLTRSWDAKLSKTDYVKEQCGTRLKIINAGYHTDKESEPFTWGHMQLLPKPGSKCEWDCVSIVLRGLGFSHF